MLQRHKKHAWWYEKNYIITSENTNSKKTKKSLEKNCLEYKYIYEVVR